MKKGHLKSILRQPRLIVYVYFFTLTFSVAYSFCESIRTKITVNANKQQRKKESPTDSTVPLLNAFETIEQIKATSNWIEPKSAEAVPLLFTNGVIANSVVVGKSMPIGNT